jgi:cell division septation protein DedD
MAYAAVTPRPALNTWSPWIYAGLKTLTVLVAFGGLAGLIWYSYAEGARHSGKRLVPVIQAAAGPLKTRPAEPGGVKVPHKDKRVYERIAPERKRKLAHNVERLIPRPAPVSLAPREKPSKSKAKEPAAAKPSKTKGNKIKGKKRTVAKRDIARKPKARSGPNPALAKAAYRVQIAAYPTPQMAARRWKRLVARHKDLVGKFDWYVEKVDRTGGRKPLYRLQVGPLKNRKAAKALCAKLGKRKVSCLSVRG